ncbi:Nucleoside-diphosphate-sugar epimerase [Paenibacillus sophorae]|uniref:NAD-dependent epimerase/dehydratase family protein n=1 Tax=Paenibacillus sophorae TaxID=1333845 RepID=A0A1H8FV43_9BACL|nr:NAD-dependent epimerase/dehydratase family protein [Paenibacillus sophorae]QWU13992.1 NAD-dependent epimerase/dehydratase family protein [Paenibacillus sophorae]SEN35542.1 Nucleoside-diphosphate-sugar epimerase [Paenibacillus sophorae]
MKVLVTGGYGFIGSHVSDRFHKEGYDVYIIDDLSSGSKHNIQFAHKGYILSINDPKCEEVFRSNRFDAVIHLAAQNDAAASMESPLQDTESNVLGLSSMLTMASRYGVKKFIFASSAAVYGINEDVPLLETAPLAPNSVYGVNKMIGETYCAKWKEIYGLDTVCFRLSNVYGPRQGNKGKRGAVSIFMHHLMENQDITVFGDGNQTRDFIYVEDVVDAIYRSSYSSISGVYNLSTGKENSINELIDELQMLHGGTAGITYTSPREGDVYRSTLNNSRIMHDLDWAPKYSLQEGLDRTYNWKSEKKDDKSAQNPVSKKNSPLRKKLNSLLPYAENLIAFAVLALIDSPLERTEYAGVDLKIVFIIVMGILYGSRQSMLAVMLSVILFIQEKMDNGRDLLSLLYDTTLFFQTALYLFIGLVVGYSVEHRINKLNRAERQLLQAGEKYTFLYEVYEDTRSVKDQLQQQIRTTEDSFGKINAVTRELESLEPERIFLEAVGAVEKIMKTDQVSIYTVNKSKQYLRLAAHSSGASLVHARSLKVEEHPHIMSLLEGKRLYVNKELLPGLPLLAAPVISSGEVVAVVAVHAVEFSRFTQYYQNLFKTVVDLISSSLSRAHAYVEAAGDRRYIDGVDGRILRTEAFMSILASKQAASERFGVDYVLLSTGFWNASAELAERIHTSLRETDYLGLGEDGELLILLSNSNQNDAQFVMDRLSEKGIFLQEGKESFYV